MAVVAVTELIAKKNLGDYSQAALATHNQVVGLGLLWPYDGAY